MLRFLVLIALILTPLRAIAAARRLKELEIEIRRLKAAGAELTLEKQALKDALEREW